MEEGTPGKYTIIATRPGRPLLNESRSTLAKARVLEDLWKAAGYDVDIIEGRLPALPQARPLRKPGDRARQHSPSKKR